MTDDRSKPGSRKPNFFILGAPKCGTTSLARWLAQHPNIFISPEKEPHFFNTDDPRRAVSSLDEYEALFSGAREDHLAIGEASVWYLSSSAAVPNILRYQPDAKFIVMVRNPIQMAPALHGEMVLSGHENIRDFAVAWNLQDERCQGRKLPAFTWAKRRLLYSEVCSLGKQLKWLLSLAPTSRILVIVLDDICADARHEYLRVLEFLGVPDDGRVCFPAYNTSRRLRWPRLTRSLFMLSQLKRKMGLGRQLNLTKHLQAANVTAQPRPTLSTGIFAVLANYFESDINLLSHLLEKDFHSWLA